MTKLDTTNWREISNQVAKDSEKRCCAFYCQFEDGSVYVSATENLKARYNHLKYSGFRGEVFRLQVIRDCPDIDSARKVKDAALLKLIGAKKKIRNQNRNPNVRALAMEAGLKPATVYNRMYTNKETAEEAVKGLLERKDIREKQERNRKAAVMSAQRGEYHNPSEEDLP